MTLTHGSLFTGIGGADLAMEAAGFRTEWQVEIDEYCTAVLAKHWPTVVRIRDVHDAGSASLARVDAITAGFPCQDVSLAGKRAGLAGDRSGLWFEAARVIRELRPRIVIVENVAGLRSQGLSTVLADLAALGFDAWWTSLRASDVGAPHRRERVFVVAHNARQRLARPEAGEECAGVSAALASREDVANTDGTAKSSMGGGATGIPAGLDRPWPAGPGETQAAWEPARTNTRVQNRQQRLKALGNAIVPAQFYPIACVARALLNEGSEWK
jgi:DNA (cytosine-5)-methyltransferase 1